MLTVASSSSARPGRSRPAGIETVGSSADVGVGSRSAPDSRSLAGGCPASAFRVRAGASTVAVDGASVTTPDGDSGASGRGVSAAEVGAASVVEENGSSDASGCGASGARTDGSSDATGDGDSASGADAAPGGAAAALGSAAGGALDSAVEDASLAGGVIGRPVGGVGVSSDRSADGAADGAKVTVSSGAAAADPPRAIVGTGPGSAAAAVPDLRTAPSNG